MFALSTCRFWVAVAEAMSMDSDMPMMGGGGSRSKWSKVEDS